VIGARFGADLLAALGIDAALDELITTELIDQVRFTPSPAYAFCHPLIHAVAYESQLKSDRAQRHRRLAAVIESGSPESVDQNSAMIAEHLEAARELHAAYGWHMRAGAWSTNRNLDAARLSWQRAQRIADGLPEDDPGHLSMRIAPAPCCAPPATKARQSRKAEAVSRSCASCAPRPGTRSPWPSA
jgi:predicted ATPase